MYLLIAYSELKPSKREKMRDSSSLLKLLKVVIETY